MLFSVEMDHVKSGPALTPETGEQFIKEVVLPTIERAAQLVAEKKILAGGPVLGRVALRFIVDVDSLKEVDHIVTSLPLWPLAETQITALIGFDERRAHVQKMLERLASSLKQQ